MKTPRPPLTSPKNYLLAAGLLATVFTELQGAITAQDGFETDMPYVAGATINDLDGGSGFSGPWSVDLSSGAGNAERYIAVETGLDYSGATSELLTRSGGMKLVARGSGKALLRRPFPALTGEVWFSLLTVLTTDSSWNWSFGLEDDQMGEQVSIQNYSSNSVFRLEVGGTTAVLSGVDPYDDPVDGYDARLVVCRIVNAGSGQADATVEVWINPNDPADLGAGAQAQGQIGGLTIPALSSFFFDKGAAPEGFFDELRIGDTYADVVPFTGGGGGGGGGGGDPDPDPVLLSFDFSNPDANSVSALQVRGWDFSQDQGTAEVLPLVTLAPFSYGLILGGNTVEQPRVSYDFGPWSQGAIEFFGYTRSSYSQARVAIEDAGGQQLFAFYMIAPNKVAVEAGTGGLPELIIPNDGSNDLINNDLGYSKFNLSWNGNSVSWHWQHYNPDGSLNHEESSNSATFTGSGTPATLVLTTSKHDFDQRQFGISNLKLANTENGLDPGSQEDGNAPERRDLTVSTAVGLGADTFVQAGKTLDRGARTYLASQRYSEVGPDDKALRQAYLRFDLGSLEDVNDIERAALEMTISQVGVPSLVHEFTIYGLNDDAPGQNWDELNTPFETEENIPPGSSLDYETDNNINPATTTILGTVVWGGDISEEVDFHSAEMVSFLKSDSDGLVTLIFQWTQAVVYDGTGDDRLHFASKENIEGGQHAPQLVFDIANSGGPGELTEEQRLALESLQADLYAGHIGDGSETQVNNHLSVLNANGSFSDIQYGNSSSYELHLARLTEMAFVYLSDTAALGGDASLLTSIAGSLDWWLTTDYIDWNWWWTYIGYPGRLAPIVTTLGPQLQTSHPQVFDKLIGYYDRVYEHLLVNPQGGGANLADMSYYSLVGAIMENDVAQIESLIENGFNPVIQVLPVSSLDDGLRTDGTIYSHGPQLYNGTYGHELLNSTLNGFSLLRGSIWDLGDNAIPFVEKILLDGLARMSYGNWFDYNAMGRAVSRQGSHTQARAFLNDIELVMGLDPDSPAVLEKLRDEIRYDGILKDTGMVGVSSFWYSDFLTYQRPDFYTSVRMVSTRTEYNEKGNGEGLKHRYFGDGVNFTLVKGNEYDNIQPVWNYERLPGITAEQDGTTTPSKDWGDSGRSSYAGSVNDGDIAFAAMRLDHDGVTAWKSWFLSGDKIMALGSDINGSETVSPVYTTLNQKIKSPVGDATYSQSGVESSLGLGQSASVNGDTWVWEGDIGYVIPAGSGIAKIDTTNKSGKWSDLGTGSSTSVSANVFTLALDHGTKPFDQGYQYTVLPGADLATTREFAQNPTVQVIANSKTVHAVHDLEKGKSAVAFLASGASVTLPDNLKIQSYGRILLIVEASMGVYRITAADPMHILQSITLSINRKLEGGNTVPLGSTQTQVTIPLPSGDHQGAPTTVIYTDPTVAASQWAYYFGDIQTSLPDGTFHSAQFGFFNGSAWPWVWSYNHEQYFYLLDSIPPQFGMFWYSVNDAFWLYTNSIFYPWYYNYRDAAWRVFPNV
jgi:chondroitin AC lyase